MIDSHAHLTSDELYPNIDDILQRAKEHGLEHIVNICTDLKTLKRGLELSQKYPWVYNAGSTTPHDVEKEGDAFFKHFEKAAVDHKLVAVGETGLDYYYEHSPKDTQKEFFIRYIELAKKTRLPLIIHCRDAFEDFFEIIDAHYPENAPGVLHCFTGTLQDAQKLIDRGWLISLSGIITYKKSDELRKVAAAVPIEHLLIETDAPYLAPQKYRGQVNEPAYVVETAAAIAQVKNISIDEVIRQTTKNAAHFFKLRKSTDL